MSVRDEDGESVAFGEGGKDSVLVIDEAAFGEHQHRQGLIVFPQKFGHFPARFRPGNAANVKPVRKPWKRGKHAFHERAMPAIEGLAGIGGVFESRGEYVERVFHALGLCVDSPDLDLAQLCGRPAQAASS